MSKSHQLMSDFIETTVTGAQNSNTFLDLKNFTCKTNQISESGLKFWINTFPAESGGARRCSRSLATSRLPYLEATCRGVKPFC